MKLSEAIKILSEIRENFGDLHIAGGYVTDDSSVQKIVVVDANGVMMWPENHESNGVGPTVFLES